MERDSQSFLNPRTAPPPPQHVLPTRVFNQQHQRWTPSLTSAYKDQRTLVDAKAFKYVEPVNERLVCPICFSPFDDPVRLACDHFFCRDCIERSLAIQANSSQTCPTCRSPTTNENITPAPRLVKQLVDELKVNCPFYHKGRCEESMPRSSVQDHLDAYCAYVKLKCPAVSCSHWVLRQDWGPMQCLHQMVICSNCEAPIMERDIEYHQASDCDNRPISCPDCKSEVDQLDLAAHVDVCPEAFTCCMFSFFAQPLNMHTGFFERENSLLPRRVATAYIALIEMLTLIYLQA